MSVVCQNPKRDRHECAERLISIEPLAVKWGDIRDDWQGDYSFCSFQCLSEWASEKADQHDGHVLREGA